MRKKNWMPDKSSLEKHFIFRQLSSFLKDEDLWHMNSHSVSEAILWGTVCCFLPIPFQMLPCLLLCIWRRTNIPIAIAVVWISNPITMAPMMYFAFEVGAALTGTDITLVDFDLSWDWVAGSLSEIWRPLILGCLVCGFSLGIVGYLMARVYYWRTDD
jgi:uncharacterized protein (DUF2062 family)